MAENAENRDPVEQLAEEYTRRLRNGERPTVSEYVKKYPQYADEIRELFPMVASMERLSSHETAERKAAQSQTAVPLATDHIGDYRIIREIGRGGMGIVYEAQQESLRRRVAIKVLAASATASSRQVQRFAREARAAASLHHTNIVPVFGFGQEDGRHYYVMQLIEGVGLDEILRAMASDRSKPASADADPRCSLSNCMAQALQNGRFARKEAVDNTAVPPDEDTPESSPPGAGFVHRDADAAIHLGRSYWDSVGRIGLQLADALQYAHQQGVLHRDIKPSNLLLDGQGTVWITDFGLAKHEDHEAITQASDIVGTVRYMAPEQFNGPADSRSDIYSLGLTLYEMLTLTPAYGQTGYGQLIHRKTTQAPQPPHVLKPDVPRDLEIIVLKACATDPGRRYQTAGDLAADLGRFLDGRPILARRVTPLERLWRWSRRNPAIAALSAAAVFLLVTVAVVSAVGRYRAGQLLKRVADERTLAEANLQLAVRAFDNIINRVASRGLPQSFELDLGVDPSAIGETAITPADAELLQSLLAFFADFAERNGVDLRAETANAYRRIGDIRLRLGQLQEAGNAYRNALKIYEALQNRAPHDPTLLLARAQVLNATGVACSRGGDWRGAVDAHSQAGQVLALVPEDQRGEAAKFEQARTLNWLASAVGRSEIARVFGSPRAAVDETAASLRGGVRRRALLTGRALLSQSRLSAVSPNPLAPRVAQIDAYCRQAEQILLELVQQRPANAEYRVELSQCYRNAMRIQSIEGRSEQAEKSLDKAVDILNQLTRDYLDNPQFQYHLADVLCLAIPQSDVPSPEERERIVEAALMCRRLTSIYPNVPEYQTLMAGAWMKLADLQYDANELDAAEQNYTQATTILNSLVQQSPDVFLYGLMGIRSWMTLSDLRRDRGRLEPAREAIDEAIAIYERDAKSHLGNVVSRRLLRQLYARQVRILTELGRPYLASQALMKARSELAGTPADSGDVIPDVDGRNGAAGAQREEGTGIDNR
jgi:serine/threonine protein kinase/tetratricopeptide (TPR) repeat protein